MDRILYCQCCTLTLPEATPGPGASGCPRCGAILHHRQPHALEHCTAFALAGFIMLIPANLLPFFTINLFGQTHTNTIFTSVRSLYRDGLWGIALIVFTASILVPLLKLVSLSLLIHAAHTKPTIRRRSLTRLHSLVKYIGRWSMLDVFLVTFLAGAMQSGSLASVRPEPGVIAFAAGVVLTMIATESFDSRLLWDADVETTSLP